MILYVERNDMFTVEGKEADAVSQGEKLCERKSACFSMSVRRRKSECGRIQTRC